MKGLPATVTLRILKLYIQHMCACVCVCAHKNTVDWPNYLTGQLISSPVFLASFLSLFITTCLTSFTHTTLPPRKKLQLRCTLWLSRYFADFVAYMCGHQDAEWVWRSFFRKKASNGAVSHHYHHHHLLLPLWIRSLDLFRHRRVTIVSWGVHYLFFL